MQFIRLPAHPKPLPNYPCSSPFPSGHPKFIQRGIRDYSRSPSSTGVRDGMVRCVPDRRRWLVEYLCWNSQRCSWGPWTVTRSALEYYFLPTVFVKFCLTFTDFVVIIR